MIAYPLQSIRDYWQNCVHRFPRKTAFIYAGQSITYAQADEWIQRLRGHLERECGLKPGDRVSFVMPNCLEYAIGYWAVIHAGGIVVPINTRLRPEEIQSIQRSVESEILFIHSEMRALAEEAFPAAQAPRFRIAVGWEDGSALSYEAMIAGGEPEPTRPEIPPEAVAIIMHTSGTTGMPKGAYMRHTDLFFNVKHTIFAQSFRHEDIHLLVTPMFHATALYSLLPSAAYQGSTLVITPPVEIKELLSLIQEHRITTFLGVPTMMHFMSTLRDLGSYDLSSLRLCAYAGSPMPPQTIRRLRERLPGVALHNFFGLTETISATHVLPDQDADTRPDSIGKLLPEVYQKIIDEEGNEVPPGVVGELCFHRSNVVQGYWNQPGRLEKSIVDGWFRTGDLACMDEEGYVHLKGRKKEMIIVAGENVYALEVENALYAHDGVLEAAVIGVPAIGARAYLGELVKAVIVPKEGVVLTEVEIKRHCAERLPSYKVPQVIEFREKLPRNASGKVVKRELL
ncbi:MAG TPA: long-chain fatty acid--CoA ligase [Armatimonadetes bacterium]|nr:long-chain fatty acid--CoA ligase [Armatimonadota bacterium]